MGTYTWSNILDFAKPYVSNIPTSSIDAVACDQINRIIWRAYYWRWTLDDLTAISLYTGPQDWAVTDTDMYRLYRCRITWVTTTNQSDEKTILEFLPPNLNEQGGLYDIRAVAMISTSTIRLDRAFNAGGSSYRIDGEFQTVPTKITATSATIVFPDDYVDVAIEGIKWKYMNLAKDPRAGGVNIDATSGRRAMTGQYATFMGLLQEMKETEDSGNAQAQRFPDAPLGIGRGGVFGIFG